MWQFYQSDDVKDNGKTDELAELFMQLNPRNDKPNVVEILKDLMHQRQQNGFSAAAAADVCGSEWGMQDVGRASYDAWEIANECLAAHNLKLMEA